MSAPLSKIAIGSDHGGYKLKNHVISHLENKGIQVIDCGTNSSESVDYPDFAESVVKRIHNNDVESGILICGTGIGISIKANRFQGIRAAVVHNAFTAEMSKAHNNANILCLGERTTEQDDACHFIDVWLKTEFEGGRHQRRLDKLDSN